MFYLLGAGGLAAAIFTILIPESDIDHDRARQLGNVPEVENGDTSDNDDDEAAIEAFAKRFSSINESSQRSSSIVHHEDNNRSGERLSFIRVGSSSFLMVGSSSQEIRSRNSTTRSGDDSRPAESFRSSRSSFLHAGSSSFMIIDSSISETRPQISSSRGVKESPEEIATLDEKAQPSRYLDLLKNPSIIFFAILTFFYHLANAGVVPLLAQYLAITSSVRASLAWTSALLLYTCFFQAVSCVCMVRIFGFIAFVLNHSIFVRHYLSNRLPPTS